MVHSCDCLLHTLLASSGLWSLTLMASKRCLRTDWRRSTGFGASVAELLHSLSKKFTVALKHSAASQLSTADGSNGATGNKTPVPPPLRSFKLARTNCVTPSPSPSSECRLLRRCECISLCSGETGSCAASCFGRYENCERPSHGPDVGITTNVVCLRSSFKRGAFWRLSEERALCELWKV
jgi:hypothetical protein